MTDVPLIEVVSHIAGKNAKVRVYADRVEWERGKSVSGAKTTAAVLTGGLSAAVTGGVKSRKGAGTEVIPMRMITSVTTRRDSMLNDVVSVVTSGNTIDMRCSKREAAALRSVILDGIMGRLDPTSQPALVSQATPPTPAPAAAPPPPPSVPAGWHPDPSNPAIQRYWDGQQWTEHTAPAAAPPPS